MYESKWVSVKQRNSYALEILMLMNCALGIGALKAERVFPCWCWLQARISDAKIRKA